MATRFGIGRVMILALLIETASRVIRPFASGDAVRVAVIVRPTLFGAALIAVAPSCT
ncbi:MAG TPA: hypothetical protein VFC31_15555 [Candidatus Limnocylindria bacterium]|nr:hypothetical protein [Candidatus Limnocylindria bacterium]